MNLILLGIFLGFTALIGSLFPVYGFPLYTSLLAAPLAYDLYKKRHSREKRYFFRNLTENRFQFFIIRVTVLFVFISFITSSFLLPFPDLSNKSEIINSYEISTKNTLVFIVLSIVYIMFMCTNIINYRFNPINSSFYIFPLFFGVIHSIFIELLGDNKTVTNQQFIDILNSITKIEFFKNNEFISSNIVIPDYNSLILVLSAFDNYVNTTIINIIDPESIMEPVRWFILFILKILISSNIAQGVTYSIYVTIGLKILKMDIQPKMWLKQLMRSNSTS